MTNTNQNVDLNEVWNKTKKDFMKTFDEQRAEYGRTREEWTSDIIAGVISAVMFGRAARKGNVAKTLFWATAAMNRRARYAEMKRDVQRKREREAADRFFAS